MPQINPVMPTKEQMNKLLGYDECVRLYNSKGEHILSILRCQDDYDSLDLATPDGKVLACETVRAYGEDLSGVLVSLIKTGVKQPINRGMQEIGSRDWEIALGHEQDCHHCHET